MHHPCPLSPVSGRIYGVVLNDRGSVDRLGAALSQPPLQAPPTAPVMYIKPANTVRANGTDVVLPANAPHVEIGATVAAILHSSARSLNMANALPALAGLRLAADLSLPHSSYYRPAIREKCFDGSCVVSNALAPATSIDPSSLVITTFINEKQVSAWSLNDLVRNIPQLLVDVTEFMTLEAGDMLLVGVQWQAPQADTGDKVRIQAQGLGELNFTISAQPAKAAR